MFPHLLHGPLSLAFALMPTNALKNGMALRKERLEIIRSAFLANCSHG